MTNQSKIPSVISYSGSKIQWGSDISDASVTMVNLKLELDVLESKLDELMLTLQILEGTDCLNFETIRTLDSEIEYSAKPPSEIVADYLTEVFKRIFEAFKDRWQNVVTKMPVDFVFTTPVVRSLMLLIHGT